MFRINWDENLSTGIAAIDSQHREIFSRFNALLEACDRGRSREALADILEFMNSYVLQHFRDEEALQAKVGFPQLPAHRRQHRELAEKFTGLQQKHAAHGATVQLVVETCKFLAGIFFDHIQLYYKALAEFIGAAPPPAGQAPSSAPV